MKLELIITFWGMFIGASLLPDVNEVLRMIYYIVGIAVGVTVLITFFRKDKSK